MHCHCGVSGLCGVITRLSGFLPAPSSDPAWCPHQVCLPAVALRMRVHHPLLSSVDVRLHLAFGSARRGTNPAWSGITEPVPTSLLPPLERENLIGSARLMGWFLLGQVSTGVSGSSGKDKGATWYKYGPIDSPFTKIVVGVQAALYKMLLMRLTPSKEFCALGFGLMRLKLFQENSFGYSSGTMKAS